VDRLVGVWLMGYFIMRGLEMQLWLFENILADWLGIFCMAHIMYRKCVVLWERYRDLLPVSVMKRQTFCIVRKGEKQIQILDGY
jgi:hypothetical protein